MREDRRLHVLQWSPGVDTEFVTEHPARIVEGAQSFSLAAGPVQRERELRSQALAKRHLRDELRELGDDGRVPTECKVDRHPGLDGRTPAFFESRRQPGREVEVDELGQRGAPPQCEGVDQHHPRVGGSAARHQRVPLVDHRFESPEVHLLGVDGQPVSRRFEQQRRIVTEPTPEPRHVRLQRAQGRRGRFVGPHCFQQRVEADDPAAGREEGGEQPPRLRAAHIDQLASVARHFERTQQPEPQERPPHAVVIFSVARAWISGSCVAGRCRVR